MIFMGFAQIPHGSKHRPGYFITGFHCGTLRQVQQHRSQHIVLVVQGDAAHQVRVVFAGGNPAGEFTAGPATGQDENRTTGNLRILECVRMDGYKQICAVFTCFLEAVPQRDVVITTANQHTAHTRLGINGFLKFFCDCEHNVFFTRPLPARGAGVFTSMTRVNGNHDIPVLFLAIGELLDGAPAVFFGIQVYHQAVAVTTGGFKHETFNITAS